MDCDGKEREVQSEGGLQVIYWSRYEIENFFITPEVLRTYATEHYKGDPHISTIEVESQLVLDSLVAERILKDSDMDMSTWKSLNSSGARAVWNALTGRVKLSDFAEEFFRRLAKKRGDPMLARKGDLYKLVRHAPPESVSMEVKINLDKLNDLLISSARE